MKDSELQELSDYPQLSVKIALLVVVAAVAVFFLSYYLTVYVF